MKLIGKFLLLELVVGQFVSYLLVLGLELAELGLEGSEGFVIGWQLGFSFSLSRSIQYLLIGFLFCPN